MPETETMERASDLRGVLETMLFITDHPVGLSELAKVAKADAKDVEAAVREIQRDYEEGGRPLQVLEVAEGFQMATRTQFAPFVRELFRDRMSFRLSSAALETLSIIAYRQPITRAEIEDIRGVEVIAALETLLEKRMVKVVGRKEVVGRPLLYGTTLEFLRHFGLKSLEELPNLDTFTPPPEAPAAPAETPAEPAPDNDPGIQPADAGALGGSPPETQRPEDPTREV